MATEESHKYLEEAAEILKYDVSAPKAVRTHWEQPNGIEDQK